MRMHPSADPRAPGIYQTFDSPVPPPLSVANTRVAGFVGVAPKGTLNQPVRVANFDEYIELFGVGGEGYLGHAVHAFFRNGGRHAWVVRIAHTDVSAREVDASDAGVARVVRAAEHVQLDRWKKPTFRVRALNEGAWGNAILFQCAETVGAAALLTRDLEIGAGEALVSSTRGFAPGALVRIYNREGEDFVVLTEVGDKIVRWGTTTPVNRKHRAAAPTHLEVVDFEVQVVLRDRREVFRGLQMHPDSAMYAPRVIEQRSRLIRLEDLQSTSPVPHNRPQPGALARLAGGDDGIAVLTPEDFIGEDHGPGQRSGLMALAANEEVGILACPDAMLLYERAPGPAGELRAQRVADQMVSICELQKDRFAILDIPQSRDIEWVRRWRRRMDSSFCAFYWPWIVVQTEDDRTVTIPPSGPMAGVYAAVDEAVGVHHPPANREIVNAVDISLRVTEDHIGLLNAESVNTFRVQRGIRPWGARTASSDPQWRYISVRRLFIMLRRSLDAGFSWLSFEPNNHKTWEQVTLRTRAFLSELQQKGMFAPGNADAVYYVQCDEQNNTPESIELGILTCDIGVAPVTPAEFIQISLVQTLEITK